MNNWVSGLSVKGVNSLLSLASLFVVSRHFGAAGKGHIAEALLPATTLMLFIKLGIDTASAIGSRRDAHIRQGFLGALLLYVCICLSIVLLLSTDRAFAMWDAILPNVPMAYIVPALWLIPFQVGHDALMNAVLGVSSFVRFNLVKVLQPLIFCVSLFGMLWGGMLPLDDSVGLIRVIWLYPLSYALAGILMVLMIRGLLPFSMKGSFTVCLSLLRMGGPIHLAFLLLYLNRRIDTWIIQRFLDPEDNGIYSVVVAYLEAAWFVSRPMSSLVLQQSISGRGAETAGRVLRISMAFSTVYLVVLALAGSWVLSLAGAVFSREGYVPMLWLMPGILMFNLLQVLSQVLYAYGSPRHVVRLALLSLLLNIAVNLVCVESIGLAGVALASTLSYSLLGWGILALVSRHFQVPVLSLAMPRLSDFSYVYGLLRFGSSGKIQP
ncbi:MAG: polysaccharide biosynthesis C-terminal domain-containing protein [Planctomycetota bacterium]